MSVHDLVPWNWGSKAVPIRRRRRGSDVDHPVSRLFDDFLSDFPLMSSDLLKAEEKFNPRVNVKDTDKSVIVSAEVPGLEEGDFDITLNADSLVIKGEKKFEHEETEKEGRHYIERSYGSFQRVVPLQADIDEDAVEAKFKHGVVTITLPKSIQSQDKTRKISVRSGS